MLFSLSIEWVVRLLIARVRNERITN